jgi:hypothetical protein
MQRPNFDRPGLRVLGLALAIIVLFGWQWGSSYRSRSVDFWELPILSGLLLVAAAIPAQLRIRPVAVVAIILGACSLSWWAVERAEMQYGGLDIGGIILRIVVYGVAFVLLRPRRTHQ